MKARLIAQKRPPEVDYPASEVWAIDPNGIIPKGWEEVEVVSEGTSDGIRLADKHGEFDLCRCDHDRRSHDKHIWRCMARTHAQQCECLQFREKR